MKKAPKLTAWERDLIALWHGQKLSVRQIARQLKRSPATISREIRRNVWKDKNTKKNYYVSCHAQGLTDERKSLAGKRHPLKNAFVYAYVVERLKWGWSPEQIAGRLKKKSGRSIICHETIYSFIYTKENKDKKLWEYLPWKRRKRKIKKGRKVCRSRIPNRVSIHKRPGKVNKRFEFGHWEGDSVEGRKALKEAIHTEVERLSRFLLASKVKNLTSKETIKVQKQMFLNLPQKARKSTTLDNGRENHLHTRLRKKLNMKTYHCDPYSSWQKGCNEHHNGLLRRYLPKKTDFNNINQEELNDIVEEINTRPRKCLNYQTPKEVFKSCLKKLGVAIQS
jgi:transposase, IS30 family